MSIFSKFRKNTPATATSSAEMSVVVSSSATLTTRYIEVRQKTKGVLSAVPITALNGYTSPSGGFVNYARYQVTGVNPSTNRKNKRVYEVSTEELACSMATSDGLSAPYTVVVLPSIPPTENQLSFAKTLEAVLPSGACSFDVSAIISRITDNDEAPISSELAYQAHCFGLKFSRYHGKKAIMNIAKSNLSVIEYSRFILALK